MNKALPVRRALSLPPPDIFFTISNCRPVTAMFAASRNAVNDSQPASVFMALTESALLSRSASRSSEVAIPRRLYRLSTAIRAMSPEAGSKMQYPTCVPSARALSPAKSPAARLMASGLFCQEDMKSQNCGSGANRPTSTGVTVQAMSGIFAPRCTCAPCCME